jgi:hypothetical protein
VRGLSRTLVTGLLLAVIVSLPAVADEKQQSQPVKIDSVTVTKDVAPDSAPALPQAVEQPEQPVNYDSFIDENKNGIDDKYEQAEKKRVKVQPAQNEAKPIKTTEPKKKKKDGG